MLEIKTTINIPEEIHKRLKLMAADNEQPLNITILNLIMDQLAQLDDL